MGMLGTGEDAQVAHLLAAQRATGDHALDRLFKHALRKTAFQYLGRRGFLDAAGIAGVLVIDLVGQLLAGELHLARVDDDDIVTAIDMGREAGLVLATQDICHGRSETANDEAFRVDQDPLLINRCRACRLGRLHQRLHGANTPE